MDRIKLCNNFTKFESNEGILEAHHFQILVRTMRTDTDFAEKKKNTHAKHGKEHFKKLEL
jgi:hypothetical protein